MAPPASRSLRRWRGESTGGELEQGKGGKRKGREGKGKVRGDPGVRLGIPAERECTVVRSVRVQTLHGSLRSAASQLYGPRSALPPHPALHRAACAALNTLCEGNSSERQDLTQVLRLSNGDLQITHQHVLLNLAIPF